jgi:monoamine oxidase
MVVDLPPNTVFCQMPVVSIDQTRAHAPCAVQTASGVAFAGWRVIVSVPTTLYDTISFKPSLPSGKSMLSENTAMGYYSKMIFLFSEPWWRNAGLSGIFNAENGPVRFSRDTSVPSDNQWSITCFIVAERGRQWSKLSKAARRRQVWAQFSQAFGKFVDNLPAPTNILEIEWSRQAFFLGAPCPVMAPGVLTAVGTDLVTPFQNVHFVGTETATVWRGYMEGAVRSGQREGAKVVKSLKGITAKF